MILKTKLHKTPFFRKAFFVVVTYVGSPTCREKLHTFLYSLPLEIVVYYKKKKKNSNNNT